MGTGYVGMEGCTRTCVHVPEWLDIYVHVHML